MDALNQQSVFEMRIVLNRVIFLIENNFQSRTALRFKNHYWIENHFWIKNHFESWISFWIKNRYESKISFELNSEPNRNRTESHSFLNCASLINHKINILWSYCPTLILLVVRLWLHKETEIIRNQHVSVNHIMTNNTPSYCSALYWRGKAVNICMCNKDNEYRTVTYCDIFVLMHYNLSRKINIRLRPCLSSLPGSQLLLIHL